MIFQKVLLFSAIPFVWAAAIRDTLDRPLRSTLSVNNITQTVTFESVWASPTVTVGPDPLDALVMPADFRERLHSIGSWLYFFFTWYDYENPVTWLPIDGKPNRGGPGWLPPIPSDPAVRGPVPKLGPYPWMPLPPPPYGPPYSRRPSYSPLPIFASRNEQLADVVTVTVTELAPGKGPITAHIEAPQRTPEKTPVPGPQS